MGIRYRLTGTVESQPIAENYMLLLYPFFFRLGSCVNIEEGLSL